MDSAAAGPSELWLLLLLLLDCFQMLLLLLIVEGFRASCALSTLFAFLPLGVDLLLTAVCVCKIWRAVYGFSRASGAIRLTEWEPTSVSGCAALHPINHCLVRFKPESASSCPTSRVKNIANNSETARYSRALAAASAWYVSRIVGGAYCRKYKYNFQHKFCTWSIPRFVDRNSFGVVVCAAFPTKKYRRSTQYFSEIRFVTLG